MRDTEAVLRSERGRANRRIELASLLVRNIGVLPDDIVAYFTNNKSQIGAALQRGFVVGDKCLVTTTSPTLLTDKFSLLKDLGIITVPNDYVHATQLDKFMKENRKKFYGVNDNITDANFPKPSRVLKPGDKLHVRAFKQIVPGTTTSEERMAFLATQKAVHTGAQGASLVFEQKRDQLPKGRWYTSFDEPDRLWADAVCGHRVPLVDAISDGFFLWDLGNFEGFWREGSAFLCFCDVE